MLVKNVETRLGFTEYPNKETIYLNKKSTIVYIIENIQIKTIKTLFSNRTISIVGYLVIT